MKKFLGFILYVAAISTSLKGHTLDFTLDTSSKGKQEEILNNYPKNLLKAASEIQKIIRRLETLGGTRSTEIWESANCYWMAMSYYEEKYINVPHIVSPRDFEKFVKSKFTKITETELRIGDLIVFHGEFKEAVFDDRDGWPRKSMFSYETPYHAAVVLSFDEDSNPIVIQKDNHHSDEFSLMTLDSVYKQTKESWIKGLQKTTLEYYRLESKD
ncbi:hypothetical protein GW915_07140 [bacterium]|nr:hypothetical protein [bacterium]